MADDLRMALAEVLRKAQDERDVDFLREGVRVLSQALRGWTLRLVVLSEGRPL